MLAHPLLGRERDVAAAEHVEDFRLALILRHAGGIGGKIELYHLKNFAVPLFIINFAKVQKERELSCGNILFFHQEIQT